MRDREVLFIDEGHEVGGEAQTQLLGAMIHRRVSVTGKAFAGEAWEVPVANVSIFIATTAEHLLQEALPRCWRSEPPSPAQVARI